MRLRLSSGPSAVGRQHAQRSESGAVLQLAVEAVLAIEAKQPSMDAATAPLAEWDNATVCAWLLAKG